MWWSAGCKDSEWPSIGDLNFGGNVDVVNNATLYSVGDEVQTDGTCSGSAETYTTVVRAANLAAAQAKCLSLTGDSDVQPLWYYAGAPADGWRRPEWPGEQEV